MESEIFITKKPKSELLMKFISYYYFHSSEKVEENIKFHFYPNTINAITIYKNSKISFNENFSSIIQPTKNKNYIKLYTGLKRIVGSTEIHTPFDKIAIAFKPLGLNSFINNPLQNIISERNNFTICEFDPEIDEILDQVYFENDYDKKVEILDFYFISKINKFRCEITEKAINLILKNDDKFKVIDLSKILNISSKTLNRKFNLHLNLSVKDFIEIAHFRKTFNHYLIHNQNNKLTDLAYQFNYYDQSDFINQFKKITGINPKNLFKKVEHFGNENLFWKKN
jgi:AraC-like DNA-binding protein